MSYYLRMLCKSDRPILRSEIINFIKECAYLDAIPDFSAQFSDGGSDSPGRELLDLHYDPARRPIRIADNGPGDLLTEELEELRDEVGRLKSSTAAGLLEHLDATIRVIAIEVNRDSLSADAWAMLDCLQSFLASRHDGIVYAPDDGFYDASLQLITKI